MEFGSSKARKVTFELRTMVIFIIYQLADYLDIQFPMIQNKEKQILTFWEAGINEYLAFLLKNWLKWWMAYQNN